MTRNLLKFRGFLQKTLLPNASAGLCMLVAGSSVGWLVGLSSSPVVQGVVTSLTGLLVAIGALFGGTAPAPAGMRASPPLLAVLLLGIAVGTSGGLYTRTHNLMGTDAQWFKQQLRDAGIAETDINAALVKHLVGGTGPNEKGDWIKPTIGQLYDGRSASPCELYRNLSDEDLVAMLESSGSPEVAAFAKRCRKHPECVRAFVEELMCHQNSNKWSSSESK